MKGNYFIGIDEVGRGSFAGPVSVAAVMYERTLSLRNGSVPLRDSKRLTPNQRGLWAKYITNHPKIKHEIAHVAPSIVDRINIRRATNMAATRALRKILSNVPKSEFQNIKLYLDGGITIKDVPDAIVAKTIICGDEKYSCIKLASIMAKEIRDAYMRRQGAAFPRYGFENHKGYGTAQHRSALRRHGPCSIHRLTYLKNHRNMKSK